MSLLGYAAQAVSRGFHIFPCEPGEKLPHRIRPGKDYRVRWSEVASNDMGQVVRWWQHSPYANVGIACKPSGLLVLDCDVAKQAGALRDTPWGYLHDRLGPMVDGDDVLRELCQRFAGDGEYDRLMQTFRVCTASFGAHIYLRWPDGVHASQASPVPGALDIRCDGGQRGGYVLGAGSVIEKGMYVVEHEAPILDAAEFPWVIELARDKPRPKPVKPVYSNAAGGGYSGLVETVRNAPDGNLNNSLLWAARSMCEDGATEGECVDLLAPVYVECNGRGGERQAHSTIRSAYRLQGAKQ